jgi:hypothetical protein
MSFNFATCRRVPPSNFFPNPPIDGSERPWSRATGFQFLDSFTDEQLDMRRKAEILKYKNNNANLSKRQLYSRRARAIGVEQKTWATQPFISGNTTVTFDNKSINSNTNPNIRNLKRIENILICPSKKNPICNPSSNSDVPGNKELCYDKTVPLVGYKERISYSKIGTTWPQRSWQPGDNGFPVGKIGSGNIYTNNIINDNPNVNNTNPNINNTNSKNNNSTRNIKQEEINNQKIINKVNEEKTNNNILSIISKNNLFDYDDFFYYPEDY